MLSWHLEDGLRDFGQEIANRRAAWLFDTSPPAGRETGDIRERRPSSLALLKYTAKIDWHVYSTTESFSYPVDVGIKVK